jgi:uncharacterized protein (TIGR00369 family)
MMEPDALFERAQSVFNAQPFSRLLGATLVHLSQGVAEIALAIRPELLQQHGFVHGGVIGYLADNTLTFAAGSLLGDAVTLEYKINYVRPAKGDRLIAKAHVISSGKNIAVCHCDIYAGTDADAPLCAVAQGSIWKRN